MITRTVLVASVAALAAACATAPSAPAVPLAEDGFVIERDLAGKTVGRGVFKSITGADRPFTAYLDGSSDGETFTLVEDFVFDDGERDRKTWRLTKSSDGTYRGVREDVIGEALGEVDGKALRLSYRIRLGSRVVGFRDVLVKQKDGVIRNDATVGWRGLRVGSVRLTISRETS